MWRYIYPIHMVFPSCYSAKQCSLSRAEFLLTADITQTGTSRGHPCSKALVNLSRQSRETRNDVIPVNIHSFFGYFRSYNKTHCAKFVLFQFFPKHTDSFGKCNQIRWSSLVNRSAKSSPRWNIFISNHLHVTFPLLSTFITLPFHKCIFFINSCVS